MSNLPHAPQTALSVPKSTPSPLPKKKPSGGGTGGGGGRSNSTLSSREMEFQNWKRRKSYDPMKAAAEGKKGKGKPVATGLGKDLMSQSVCVPETETLA